MNGGHPYGDVHSNGDSAKVMYNGSYLHQQVPNLSNGDVLSKFELAKKEMLQQFVQLQKTTKALSTAFSDFSSTAGKIELDLDVKPVDNAVSQIDHINDVIARDQMKVVFFGRTSSGKSSVANAILRGKILPVGMGDTTNCFITMQGTSQSEPYMLHPLHPDTPQSVHSVAQLAHALDKNKLQRSSQLIIYWPSDKVDLLQHDIQLIDSPGISVDIQTDLWIDKYCLDADVFIFVANAESTIMETEKQFFHKVSEHLSKPNIFILQNKWDLADCSDVDPLSVKQQHVERSVEFLIDELKVMDDALEAEKRVFFISAKEELIYRIQEGKGQTVEISGEYRDAIEERRREFKSFESDFKFCVCDSAIKTKFEKHTQKGIEIMSKVTELLQNVSESAKIKRSQNGVQHNELVKQYKQMRTRAKKLEAFQREEVAKFGNQVQANFCVCDSAIKTKFEKHTQKGIEIMSKVTELLQNVSESSKIKRSQNGVQHNELVKQYKQMRTRAKKLEAFQREEVAKFGNQVQANVSTVMAEEVLQLTLILQKFPQPFPSNPSGLPQFKEDLFAFIDRELKKAVDGRYHKDIITSFENIRTRLIDDAELIIPEIWTKKQTRPVSVDFLRKERLSPGINYSVSCSSLCANFKEDLSFSFSLSLNNLLRKIIGPAMSRSMMRNAASRRVPTQEELSDSSQSSARSEQHLLVPIMASMAMLPSMGPFGLVIAGGIIWSKISWKVIVLVGGCYGGLYAYERLTWNVVAKQRSFKRQLVDFTTPQLSSVIPMVSRHCSDSLVADMQNTYDTLKIDVDASLSDSRKEIETCERDIKSLNDVVDISTSYIAKIHGHELQFTGFLQRFLQMGQ